MAERPDEPRRPTTPPPLTPPPAPQEDDGLYELAEDPDDMPSNTAAPRGLSTPPPGTATDPPAAVQDEPPTLKRPTSGPESHFSGDEPAYVNPELARQRREQQRILAAEIAAAEAQKKRKIVASIVVGIAAIAFSIYMWVTLL